MVQIISTAIPKSRGHNAPMNDGARVTCPWPRQELGRSAYISRRGRLWLRGNTLTSGQFTLTHSRAKWNKTEFICCARSSLVELFPLLERSTSIHTTTWLMNFSVICLQELRILEVPGKSGQGLLSWCSSQGTSISAVRRSSKATTPKFINGDQDRVALVQPGSS